MNYTPYVDFESGDYIGHHIARVGCMKCNDTIGTKNPDGTFYFWTHKRDVQLIMSDSSVAFAPVCSACFITVSDADLPLLEQTIKYGWLAEQDWMLNRFPSRDQGHRHRAKKFADNISVVKRGN